MSALFLQPVIPKIAIGLIVLVGVAAATWAAWRLGRLGALTAWRAVLLAGLGALLLGVSSRESTAPDQSDRTVRLLIDDSQSMCINDVDLEGERISRYEALRRTWLDPQTLAALGRDTRVTLRAFSDESAPTTLQTALRREPQGRSSRIASAVAREIEGAAPGDNLIVLTDGAETHRDSRAAFEWLGDLASAASVGVHAVGVGAERSGRDIAVRATIDQSFVHEGEEATLRIGVAAAGYEGRNTVLAVRSGSGKLVARRPFELGVDEEMVFHVTPSTDSPRAEAEGVAEYIAEVEPLDDEVETSNNVARAFIQVGSGRIRVACFENDPYWDSKFFVAAMRADAEVELTSVVGLSPRRVTTTRYSSAAEQRDLGSVEDLLTERRLFAMDVVVLGREIERWFEGDRASLLWRFVVERGGSVIFLRGDPLGPGAGKELRDVVAALRPVEWSDLAEQGTGLVRTTESRRSGIVRFDEIGPTDSVINELPDMIARTRIERERSLSSVWLRGRSNESSELDPEWAAARDMGPVALAQIAIGRGRALAVLTDGLWRWAFLPSSLRAYSSVYRLLWGRAIRALVYGGEFLPGQQMSLSVDDSTPGVDQTVMIEARARYAVQDAPPMELIVTTPGGERRRLTPARRDEMRAAWRASYTPQEAGVHRAELIVGDSSEPRAERQIVPFVASEQRVEMLHTAARPDLLRAMIERSGGQMLDVADGASLANLIEAQRAAAAGEQAPRYAWDRWWIFAILAGGLAGEWFVRRWKGAA